MKLTADLKALTVTAAMLVIMLAIPATASATSILSQFDTSVTHLEDNDWEFIQGDGDNLLEIDEFLVGMVQIQKLNHTSSVYTFTPVAGVDTTLTGIFFLQVTATSLVCDGTGCTYTFGAPDAAEYAALALAYGLPGRVDTDSVGIIFNDSSNPFVDPAAGSRTLALDTASDGTPVWEVGLDIPTNFWTAVTNTNNITAINPLTSGFGGSLNVTNYYAGAPQLTPHDFVGFGVLGDVQLIGKFEPLTGGAGANFQAQTDTDFYVQAVPEPSTICLLGLGLISAAVVSRKN
jgi:hypothetical protein